MNKVLADAIATYGTKSQEDKVIEECSELIKAILKLRYNEEDYKIPILKDAIAEEMADVEIMLEQMKMIHDNRELVESQKAKKIERLERRLKKKHEMREKNEEN